MISFINKIISKNTKLINSIYKAKGVIQGVYVENILV